MTDEPVTPKFNQENDLAPNCSSNTPLKVIPTVRRVLTRDEMREHAGKLIAFDDTGVLCVNADLHALRREVKEQYGFSPEGGKYVIGPSLIPGT